MPGEQQVDARVSDRIECQLLPTDRLSELRPVPNRQREQRVMGDQNSRSVWPCPRKGFADEIDLLLVDPPVLERQRARRVDPQHRRARQLVERAKAFVDEAAITGQRRQEASQDIVQRHIMC